MFISLEGPDGSGKTSQMEPLADFLRQRGYRVFLTREPGGTKIGEEVRSILSDLQNKMMNSRAEILLFCAARAQLVDECIKPRLSRGEIVICDRYADSTLAYQGYGYQNDVDFLRRLLDFVTGGLWPDVTFLFDIDVEEGLKRRRSAGGEWNRMDDYALAVHQRVRQGYYELARRDPQRWITIDANQPVHQVQSALQQHVSELLENQSLRSKGS